MLLVAFRYEEDYSIAKLNLKISMSVEDPLRFQVFAFTFYLSVLCVSSHTIIICNYVSYKPCKGLRGLLCLNVDIYIYIPGVQNGFLSLLCMYPGASIMLESDL